jgi:ubiquinone/menaquinone biosynthesis C-methylase UbiE
MQDDELQRLTPDVYSDVADAYERWRPNWPSEAVTMLVRRLGLGSGSTVVDVGAGTGKLTRLLVGRAGRVIAVEPVAAMREKLAKRLPDVEALAARAEALPLPAASVDAAFVAEAFHWFDADRALQELARVLRPRGGLCLLWNVHAWDEQTHPWLPELTRAFERYRTEPVARHFADQERWRASFDHSGAFDPFQTEEIQHEQRLDLRGLVGQLSSWSWIAGLPQARRKAALCAIRDAVERDLDRRGSTEVVVPYRTEVHWTRRR